ncbi:hypothetical protein MMC15_000527 [Xylographa vitiligo]|nr:hypothetical protein [Xylographa vitiligo]
MVPTAVIPPRSTDPVLDEGSIVVAASGALVAIAAPLSPPTTPTQFLYLATLVAATAFGPWGMLPAGLILLGLGVNGEPAPQLRDREPPFPQTAKRAIRFGPGITSPASSTPTLRGRALLTTTTTVASAAPTATATATECGCEGCGCGCDCDCSTLQAWKIGAIVLGTLVGISVLGSIVTCLCVGLVPAVMWLVSLFGD